MHAFVVDAPVKWEPTLDAEHDLHRWCDLDEALELLVYETTRDAVRAAARTAMRVGVDISPLVQTRAGTARHVRGLLGALRDRPGLDLELLSFGGAGRASSVVRDALWYPVALGRRARALDVLHCTTFRGPTGAGVPTVLTVHDLAILRAPEAFPRWHRLYGRVGLERVLRAADAIVAVSEFSRDETVELAGVPAERIRVIPHGVDPLFTPDGPRADGDYVLAVGDARAAEEPRPGGRGRARGRRRASRRRCARLGRSRGRGLGRRDPRRGACRAVPRCALRRSTRRCTRASACPCSRRWRAGRPS